MAVEYTIPGMLIRVPGFRSKQPATSPTWVTNEFDHDGVCQSAAVLRRLMTSVREQGGPLAS
nr:hypothetical protein [Rhizobium leguminosarum]